MYKKEVGWGATLKWSFAPLTIDLAWFLSLLVPFSFFKIWWRHRFPLCLHQILPSFDLPEPSCRRPLIHSSQVLSLSLSLQLVQESAYGEMWGTRGRRLLSRLDDVRICAYMDFLKHTFQIRFSCAPPRIPRREKKIEHMIAETQRDIPPFFYFPQSFRQQLHE